MTRATSATTVPRNRPIQVRIRRMARREKPTGENGRVRIAPWRIFVPVGESASGSVCGGACCGAVPGGILFRVDESLPSWRRHAPVYEDRIHLDERRTDAVGFRAGACER